MSRRTPEVALYAAVKAHLHALGYEAKGEVCGCDIVAVREGEKPFLVITELKAAFTLDLVLQGVDRLRAADEVWLAVRMTRRGRDQDSRAHRLCRLLGFGLLAVTPSTGHVEVLAEPAPYKPRPDRRRRDLILREHARRRGDPTPGGSTRVPVMTAYRQTALDLVAALRDGPRRPRDLTHLAPDARAILYRNVYGWFESAGRGVYRLTALGERAADAAVTAPLPPAPRS
ncbi:DUF2161 family putative PD-(D/E)XK-type phosphodiesterase [Roseomonas sp. CCTCC AB2023176]|uniref:DUF2161 family putative PD-(D/E)XK-type phosphodiesterase n=1 Tax=Roseomonas sp. CCTCC AB2023176 TaxID=3342640 RepID=UPI0035DBC35C